MSPIVSCKVEDCWARRFGKKKGVGIPIRNSNTSNIMKVVLFGTSKSDGQESGGRGEGLYCLFLLTLFKDRRRVRFVVRV